ncbi:MAG TPA: ATPase, T2SS/T4P/T4SS family [Candidatus Bathyarchaeia archaeon]|nr:ATPase, T2SS/T4P/T4SS family [Candidatus Bathyarchaeia archaeon]
MNKLPTQAAHNIYTSLEDVLVAHQVLTREEINGIKLESVSTGKSVEEIVTERKLVNPEELAKAQSAFYNIAYINLSEVGVSPTALNLIPRPVAENFTLVPFEYNPSSNELSVAMAEPLDLNAIKFIEKKSRAKIIPYMATTEAIRKAIEERYAQSLATEVKAALKRSSLGAEKEAEAIDISQLGNIIREAPIAKIVATVLEFAVKSRASDVHIEPQEEKTRVRYRIDGILHEKLVLPRSLHEAMVSRIKILSEMKIDEKRIPQDGRFTFKVDSRIVDLRVSCLPTVHGEKIVMRLLKKGGGVIDLPELGLRGRALKNLEDAILRPHGIIVVCGPTGSGKTTTLYSVISRINSSRVNILTLEDPVEYEIPGVNQVQVNRAAGLSFASGLRSFLRQDPNVIMVGEIRDEETTELAVQAALTGHLVFSTLHTSNASGALPRLLDLGGEPFLLASSITCILGQRVGRRICIDCKETYDASAEVVANIRSVLGSLYKGGNKLKLYRGKGCPVCNNTGYMERVGIFEVLPVSEKIGRLILERASAAEIEKQAVEEGMITMKQDGYLKVIEGLSTMEEILRVAEA